MPEIDKITNQYTPSLDVENKVVLPTKALYKALQTEFSSLYQVVRENLTDLHSDVAHSTMQLYRNPAETLGAWKNIAAQQADNALALLNREIVPEVETTCRQAAVLVEQAYRQGLADAARLSAETRDLVALLYAQPAETSAQIYSRLLASAKNVGGDAVQLSRQVYAETAADLQVGMETLRQLYKASADAFLLFLDAPSAVAAQFYYQVSAALLDYYSQGVAVMLELVQTAAMPSGWAL